MARPCPPRAAVVAKTNRLGEGSICAIPNTILITASFKTLCVRMASKQACAPSPSSESNPTTSTGLANRTTHPVVTALGSARAVVIWKTARTKTKFFIRAPTLRTGLWQATLCKCQSIRLFVGQIKNSGSERVRTPNDGAKLLALKVCEGQSLRVSDEQGPRLAAEHRTTAGTRHLKQNQFSPKRTSPIAFSGAAGIVLHSSCDGASKDSAVVVLRRCVR